MNKTININIDDLTNLKLSPVTIGVEVGITMGLCSLIPIHPVARLAIGAVASVAVVGATNYTLNVYNKNDIFDIPFDDDIDDDFFDDEDIVNDPELE